MELALQIWGGGFYLLNKVFLSFAEGSTNEKRWRILGWTVYLIGAPAWIVILAQRRDWIAAGIETGGLPAMILGLVVAIKGLERTPSRFKQGTGLFAYVLLAAGIAYSLYDHGGLTKLSQGLELCSMAGFLVGTYLLAKKNAAGWYWFMLMNGSMGLLMLIQHKPILAAQQGFSVAFCISGYLRSRRASTAVNRG